MSRWPAVLRWRGWRNLPREARDTLFLLGVIAWTVIPHASHLPWWCTALTAVVLVWRGSLATTNAALPGRWVLITMLAVAAGLTFWSFRTVLGKEPGITLAVVLMALKTLELRARRDAFVVFFLGFFLILTHFLYSQSILVAAAMLVSVWGLMTTLVLAHMPVGHPSLRQAGLLAARTAGLGAPIMILLFVLFPRIGPLWGVPQDGMAKTGLSNSLKMGSIAAVAQDDSIALRLRFTGTAPAPEAMYFRGPVLARFDGREWKPLVPQGSAMRAEPLAAAAHLRVGGKALHYEITLEPLNLSVVPLLEMTPSIPPIEGYPLAAQDDLVWRAERPIVERLRFEADAYENFRHGPTSGSEALAPYRWLPPGFNPRTMEWAAAFQREGGYDAADPAPIARALLKHIRTGGYTYTLAAEPYGIDAVDEFWLDRREGFCEHFAASFVVIMRALGVPARVVTGYQGADPLPVDGYYLVRQSSAHAWAEYWQRGVGWVRADPTGAVAPDRITRSRRLAPQPGFVAGAFGSVSPALLEGMRTTWETFENRWNQWVLSYSRGRQLDLLRNVGFSAPKWGDLGLALIGALSTLALGSAAWAWWDKNRLDPWVRQMKELRRSLRPLGIAAHAHDGPRVLAARVRQRWGEPSESLARLLDQLERERYGRGASARPDRRLARRLRMHARQLRSVPPLA